MLWRGGPHTGMATKAGTRRLLKTNTKRVPENTAATSHGRPFPLQIAEDVVGSFIHILVLFLFNQPRRLFDKESNARLF